MTGVQTCALPIFPGGRQQALSDRDLWLLFQRRHLIVHRRGIVDSAYIAATGEDLLVGTEMSITPRDFEIYINAVLGAAITIGSGIVAGYKRSRPQT